VKKHRRVEPSKLAFIELVMFLVFALAIVGIGSFAASRVIEGWSFLVTIVIAALLIVFLMTLIFRRSIKIKGKTGKDRSGEIHLEGVPGAIHLQLHKQEAHPFSGCQPLSPAPASVADRRFIRLAVKCP
jgi:hypothetical protein